MEYEIDSNSKENYGLFITDQSENFLREIAKWTKFLSILGFIGIGIMVLASVFIGIIFSLISALGNTDISSSFPTGLISIFYLIMAAIYVVPVFYLFKFSKNLQDALTFNNVGTLDNAFRYLKSHYKFIGILTIVILALYVLIIIGSLLFGGIAALALAQ